MDPSPSAVLLPLVEQVELTARVGPGDDDDYCFSIAYPLQWWDASFVKVCVVTDDEVKIKLHPQLYWSGAAAPWTEVWLIAALPPASLRMWKEGNLPKENRFRIDRIGDDARSALSCSEWNFPLL